MVGEIDESELHNVVSQIETDIWRSINYVLMSKEEFQKRLSEGESFIKRVMKEEEIMLKGNLNVY